MSMRKALVACAAAGLLFPAAPALADADLFRKFNCLACHAVDQKRLGPSMKEVAARYKDTSNAVDVLARKIQLGGAGVWGQLPMPPQPQVSDADAKAIAEYVLSLQ